MQRFVVTVEVVPRTGRPPVKRRPKTRSQPPGGACAKTTGKQGN